MVRERTQSDWLERPLARLPDDRPVFASGQLVSGRYRIVRFVGRGGMGEVYEAQDHELKERVALKTLLPAIARDAQMIARFKLEIQLSRKIGHPNVCRVFDLAHHPADGSSPDSVVFLSMEFLDGETLSERLQRGGPLSPAVALPILDEIAQGLDAAHRAGVIHRDLKPSNVMLAPRAVITDFGLARSFVPSGDSTAPMTRELVGTPEYMAPEVLTSHRATVSSDLYSLGMVAYKILTGVLPFAEKDPLAAAILRAHVPVPAPSSLVPNLDPALDRAILRVLDPNPTRRFSSAGSFVAALRGESPSISLTLPPLTRRNVIRGGAAATVLTAAGAGWWYIERPRGRPPAEALNFYQQGVNDIHAGAYFAATKALGQAVRPAPRFVVAHARLAEAWNELDLTERASQEMLLARREDLSAQPAPERLQVEAVDLTITREFEAATAKYEQLRRYTKEGDSGFDLDLGRAYEKAGHPQKAIESYRRAAEGPSRDPAAWLRLAVLYSRQADAAKAVEAFRQADELYQATSNLEGLTEVALQRGIAANSRGHLEEAAGDLRKALETATAAGNIHQQIVAKLNLGINARMGGDVDAAELDAREALETAKANEMQALATRGLVGLGSSYVRKGDYAGAEKYYREALEMARRNSSRRLEAVALLQLAALHDRLRKSEDSAREAQAALQFYQPNRFARETLQCLTLLGRAQSAQGDFTGALRSYRQTLDLAEKDLDHFQMALARESIGNVFADQEQYPDALREFQAYLAVATDPEHTGYAALECADALWRLGRYSEASAMYEKAEAQAGKFPPLRTAISRSRAEMLLSQGHYSQASALCRQVLSSSPGNIEVAVATRILGLARIGEGAVQEGLRHSEAAVAMSAKLGDISIRVPAELALAEARLDSGDARGALLSIRSAEPMLASFPESRWRAMALAARADGTQAVRYAAEAKKQLDAIAGEWGAQPFAQYMTRPDVEMLWRPLSRLFPANHKSEKLKMTISPAILAKPGWVLIGAAALLLSGCSNQSPSGAKGSSGSGGEQHIFNVNSSPIDVSDGSITFSSPVPFQPNDGMPHTDYTVDDMSSQVRYIWILGCPSAAGCPATLPVLDGKGWTLTLNDQSTVKVNRGASLTAVQIHLSEPVVAQASAATGGQFQLVLTDPAPPAPQNHHLRSGTLVRNENDGSTTTFPLSCPNSPPGGKCHMIIQYCGTQPCY